MNHAEQQLHTLLIAAAPRAEPIEFDAIVAQVSRRRRLRVAASAAVIVAVALATALPVLLLGSKPSSLGSTHGPNYQQLEADRTRLATAFARKISGEVPRLPGERPIAVGPRDLRRPSQTVDAVGLITKVRYWTVPDRVGKVYEALRHSSSAPHRLTGYGAPGSAGGPDNRAFVSYDEILAPVYIQEANVIVDLEANPSGGTTIASFGEVIAHPVRDAAEAIAPAESPGSVTYPRFVSHTIVGAQTKTLEPSTLRLLIRQINYLPVADSPDACQGGPRLQGDVLTIRITSGGHNWRLIYPGTACDDIAVWRDNDQLPALQPDQELITPLEQWLRGHNPSTAAFDH